VVGCSQAPLKGGATIAQLEEKIAGSKNWHDVSIEIIADGAYRGTAVTAKGEPVYLEVEQSSGSITVHWNNAIGSNVNTSEIKW
jgi:hypothetical protein